MGKIEWEFDEGHFHRAGSVVIDLRINGDYCGNMGGYGYTFSIGQNRGRLSTYFEDPLNPTQEECVMFDLEFNCNIQEGLRLLKEKIDERL